MSTIAGELVTTTASTGTSINYAGQSQLIADGKLDVAETGQTGEYHLEDRTRYRIQDTESIQSLWSNDVWTETDHNFTVDHEAHNAWVYNQTINLPKNSDPIITNNPDGSTSSQIIQLGQDQAKVTSAGGYDYHLTQTGSPSDFRFSLTHTSQSQSGKHDTGNWRAADGSSSANYDNLGSETKNSRADLAGRVQNGTVYYTGIDVYQTKNTSTNHTGSGFALGSTTRSNSVGSTQTIESRGGNSGSWYGSKLESGNSTTNYTTVSGTMGQPFSGMTQTGFNLITLYGTAAQTGITGMYGYGQTGTGGSYNTLQTSGTGTPGPVALPPIAGLPNYSTAGEYPPSQSGVVGGFVTPVSNKINFGDPKFISRGMDPRNPYSGLFDPRLQTFYESNPYPVLSEEDRERFGNRVSAIFGIIGAAAEISLGFTLILSSECTFGLSAIPGVIAVAHGGSRGENQIYQLWTGETGPNSFERNFGREADVVITVGADSVNVVRGVTALGRAGVKKWKDYNDLKALLKKSPNDVAPRNNVRVFRVEVTPNSHVVIGEGGMVAIKEGNQTVFFNFGSKARAEQYLAQKIEKGLPGATVKSFEVPRSFLDDLRASAIDEDLAKILPNRPFRVDITKAPDQFGLRSEQIEALRRAIIQGTGQEGF